MMSAKDPLAGAFDPGPGLEPIPGAGKEAVTALDCRGRRLVAVGVLPGLTPFAAFVFDPFEAEVGATAFTDDAGTGAVLVAFTET